VLGALIAGAVTMYGVNRIGASNQRLNWLREWSMGFAVIVSMIIGTLID
jgi:fructose-specific phosphotransferase system IIC component